MGEERHRVFIFDSQGATIEPLNAYEYLDLEHKKYPTCLNVTLA
jgi:hypothetical protein